jgi:predicted PurR-regulated permease PerM
VVLAVVLAIALATVAILAIVGLGLIRHVKLLALSLKRFQEETQPILEEIQREAAKAQQRGEALRKSGDRLRR